MIFNILLINGMCVFMKKKLTDHYFFAYDCMDFRLKRDSNLLDSQ